MSSSPSAPASTTATVQAPPSRATSAFAMACARWVLPDERGPWRYSGLYREPGQRDDLAGGAKRELVARA